MNAPRTKLAKRACAEAVISFEVVVSIASLVEPPDSNRARRGNFAASAIDAACIADKPPTPVIEHHQSRGLENTNASPATWHRWNVNQTAGCPAGSPPLRAWLSALMPNRTGLLPAVRSRVDFLAAELPRLIAFS